MAALALATAAVDVRGLVKRFGDHAAVDGVSLRIEPGEVFGLLGPNGAGKTTTIRVLTTLLPPSGGEVRLFGLDVRARGAEVRRLLGYVPQALSAEGALTGYENLLISAKLLGLSRAERGERIARLLEALELTEAADRLVRQYSGGMVRRLELGQALLHRPRLLILDEPTVGLDPIARRGLWALLEALRQDGGVTLLITTHSMEEADAHCDRVAILHRGRIVAEGTPEALKAAVGRPGASLDDVFAAATGASLDEAEGRYRELRQLRRRARRLG
jgi:ABC-2 type transport system ATP-binding protein